jgi:4-hydroxy-4-methyl-2-oxoglutarate aldolase
VSARTGRVVRGTPRADADVVAGLGRLGVATVHEAMGRTGLIDRRVVARQSGVRTAGSALTVEVAPGDNTMLHVAVEQVRPGDLLVVTPTSPCSDGYFGDLLATSVQARGAVGLVIDAGVRDLADLRAMGFPVWSRAVSAQGTVKGTLGTIGLPTVCAGVLVAPGDVVVADDDGVVIVPAAGAEEVLAAAQRRERAEADKRPRYAAGEVSLDLLGLREELAAWGLTYEEWA